MKPQVDLENANISRREGYTEIIKQIIADGLCPFCEENLSKYHPEPTLFQGPHWTVTKNAWPYKGTRFHFLLITRAHVEKIEDLTENAWVEFHTHYKALAEKYEFSGATIFWRSGSTKITGGSVAHLHAQIIVGDERRPGAAEITPLAGFQMP